MAKPFDVITEGARRLGNSAIHTPVGVAGRYRPFYFLNALDRLRGRDSLEAAVRDKVTMVTGASSGIGHETAVRIGQAGGTVLLVARRADKLGDTAREVEAKGGTARVHTADLSDLDDIDRMAKEVLAEHGRVDVLINNAGRSIRRSIELSYDRMHDFQRTMQLNYFGCVKLILAFLPTMRDQKEGHVINVSSVGVQARVPRFSGYVASKAALDAFSESVAAETRTDGVRFTTVYMPLVRTPMIGPTKLYDKVPALSPRQAADLITDAIVFRPSRVGTLMGSMASVANSTVPWSMEQVRSMGYHLFPDSAAAKGAAPTDDDEAGIGWGAQAFASLLRGIHW